MKTGIVLLNFGEPETAAPEAVTPFLERIFLANARLDPSSDPDLVRHRARALAERRTPELAEDYSRIGGSPLNAQTARQAEQLELALARRGHQAWVTVALQFTEPTIAQAVERALRAGVERIIALPLYPLTGPSTTMASLDELERAVSGPGRAMRVEEIAGWHTHPSYTALRADGIRSWCARRAVELDDPATRLVFAAHGTPLRYLEEGSRYDLYVGDHCRRLAAALGVERYVVGFQNHSNRPDVPWTQPDIERAIQAVEARRIVVVPVSFMQEHSETLAELDLGLAAAAAAMGLEFHRVPVPHDDPRFIELLVGLVTPLLGPDPADPVPFGPCRCRCRPGTVCLNGGLARDGA